MNHAKFSMKGVESAFQVLIVMYRDLPFEYVILSKKLRLTS